MVGSFPASNGESIQSTNSLYVTAHAKMSRLKHIRVLLHIRIEHIQSKTMTPLCHQHSVYFQRYDTSNSDNAEKIDCEKNSFEVNICIFQNCDPKTEKIDRHTSKSYLAKVRKTSVSFRALHTPLSGMKSLAKQWNNKFEERIEAVKR